MSDDSSRTERFPARRCQSCGELYGHPPAACRICGTETLEVFELSGRGRLYASTTIRVPGTDNRGEEPYRVGLVDVGDGDTVRVTARLDTDENLQPQELLEYVGKRDGTFVFRRG